MGLPLDMDFKIVPQHLKKGSQQFIVFTQTFITYSTIETEYLSELGFLMQRVWACDHSNLCSFSDKMIHGPLARSM